jgi:hypothetical protein
MGSDPIMSSSLSLLGFGEMVDGASCGHGRGGPEGARYAEVSAGAVAAWNENRVIQASLVQRLKLRPDPMFGPPQVRPGDTAWQLILLLHNFIRSYLPWPFREK